MKFLPQKFRETQADWFGKRGISWHISVVVRKVQDNLQHQTLVHIVKNSPQESNAVTWIMEHVLATLKEEHPEITTAYFRQNNAGCYHSAWLYFAHVLRYLITQVSTSKGSTLAILKAEKAPATAKLPLSKDM